MYVTLKYFGIYLMVQSHALHSTTICAKIETLYTIEAQRCPEIVIVDR